MHPLEAFDDVSPEFDKEGDFKVDRAETGRVDRGDCEGEGTTELPGEDRDNGGGGGVNLDRTGGPGDKLDLAVGGGEAELANDAFNATLPGDNVDLAVGGGEGSDMLSLLSVALAFEAVLASESSRIRCFSLDFAHCAMPETALGFGLGNGEWLL